MAACATNVAGESTSLIVSVPLVLIAAALFASVRLTVADDSTAASLVPAMLTVMVLVVPLEPLAEISREAPRSEETFFEA